MDECQTLKPCSHQCVDTPESFFCQCPRGYHLFIDEKTCLPGTHHSYENPLSYFSFQPVLHDWCNKGCGMWDDAYKRTLAVNQKE